jgi:hypothetical protein
VIHDRAPEIRDTDARWAAVIEILLAVGRVDDEAGRDEQQAREDQERAT